MFQRPLPRPRFGRVKSDSCAFQHADIPSGWGQLPSEVTESGCYARCTSRRRPRDRDNLGTIAPQHREGSLECAITFCASKLVFGFDIQQMATQSLFGVVIPGRPVITEFQVVDATKAMTIVEQPSAVTEITFFILPTTIVPPGYGAILYYSVPPFQNWILVGSVDPSKPSGTFRTNWATNEEVKFCHVVQLGVSLEP
jgi:hypothetical protein